MNIPRRSLLPPLETLDSLPNDNPLRILSDVIRCYTPDNFDRKNPSTYPRFPEREWSQEELAAIDHWLTEYDREIQGNTQTLLEMDKMQDALRVYLLGLYLDIIKGQIDEQKMILLWKQGRAKEELLGAIPDTHSRALAAARWNKGVGEA